jgi:putative RecB family exonuclease
VTEFDFTAEFNRELDMAVAGTASPFPKGDWFAAGYRPRQDETWWRENGPAMCQAFADWYVSQPEIRVWITPDGQPAIELEMTVMFGDIPVKMAPDLVLQAGSALVVTDFKSGSLESNKPRQLGLYACGVEKTYGIRPRYGTFFMAKGVGKKDEEKTYFLPPIMLDGPEYSCEHFTRVFAEFDRAVRSEVFLANPGKNCQTCGVNRACSAFGGEQAPLFDSTDPRYTKGNAIVR